MVVRSPKKDIVRAQNISSPTRFLLETLRNAGPETIAQEEIPGAGKFNKIQLLTTNQQPSKLCSAEQPFVQDFAHAIVLPTLAEKYQRLAPGDLPG